MTYRTVTLLCAILLLSACGRGDDKPPTLFKDQVDTLDKAKAINAVVQSQVEETQKAIEQQTQ